MASSSSKEALRLIPCFCRGCPDLTEDEIKAFLGHRIGETLQDPKAAKLLRKYFETQEKGDKTIAFQMLDIYEKIVEYLSDSRPITDDEVDELDELGLPSRNRRRLHRVIENTTEANECLKEIQEMCLHEIEISHDYKDFKKQLRRKLRRKFSKN